MDRSTDPSVDFYRFAAGRWMDRNPVPADHSRWGSFFELAERNQECLRILLEEASGPSNAPASSPARLVGDFYASAMDTQRIEAVGLKPLEAELQAIDRLDSVDGLIRMVATLHRARIRPFFDTEAYPDLKQSDVYVMYLGQGGLSLPDRDYYSKPEFAALLTGFRRHVARLFALVGRPAGTTEADAGTVVEIETALAEKSRSRAELRDPEKNYHRRTLDELSDAMPESRWPQYLAVRTRRLPPYVILEQPEFFAALDQLLRARPLRDWQVYLRWHLVHASAPHLYGEIEREDFEFFKQALHGQKAPPPRWKTASEAANRFLGEALGKLYVERHFPPESRARMIQLVDDLRAVFRDRLRRTAWMSEETRRRAIAKFDRFTVKIGHPERYRDYSSVRISREDYLGNVRRAAEFEVERRFSRLGQPVDRSEWLATPPTADAYFNPGQNEIVFPAGILQPPFFDASADDAVNYGAIGAVIGHEITHGYDDQGRKFDADGNLADWWTAQDAEEFNRRAKKVIDQLNRFEALPGAHVNGELTLGETLADFGGVSIAYEALERRLKAEPSRNVPIDGFTPEQRFFIAWAQVWKENAREEDARWRLTIDPHPPGRLRAIGPVSNFAPFGQAFGISAGAPMFLGDEQRVTIW